MKIKIKNTFLIQEKSLCQKTFRLIALQLHRCQSNFKQSLRRPDSSDGETIYRSRVNKTDLFLE